MDQLEFKEELTKLSKVKVPKAPEYPKTGTDIIALSNRAYYQKGYNEGVAALRKAQREYIKEIPDII